jgi:two-component system chemotaxis response regulator CheY
MNTETAMEHEPRQTSGRLKKRVLIVDDDASVRESISSVLQEAGYEVLQAGDGEQALTQFDSRQIDLILLDLGLPNKSGWDTFEGFTSQNPTLPIIIITGQARQAKIAMAAGVGALMEKPLDVAQLLQTMHDLLIESEEDRLRRLCGYSRDTRYIPMVPRYIRAGASTVAINHKPK